MPGISEIGAVEVDVKSYKCSINKITASTKWKAPGGEVPETVKATVFSKQNAKETKTIYVISSPKGENVTIKTERDEGQCQRDSHKQYKLAWDDYKTASAKNELFPNMPIRPYDRTKESKSEDRDHSQEETLKIKCFEIGGAMEALNYWKLPLALSQHSITKISTVTCAEGPIQYRIEAYPDINYSIEITVGTKEKQKKANGRSHFKRETSKAKYIPERATALVKEAPDVELKFEPPVVNVSTTYNGDEDELELEINFDSDEEMLHFSYAHGSQEMELGSEFVQDISGSIKKIETLCRLINKLCDVEKNFDEIKKSLVKNYKPYKLELQPPSVSVSVDGQYQTSKDLTRIGQLWDISCSCDPLVSISLTVDILFLIISGVTAGTGGGVYLMLKNFDDVVGKILGSYYKKKYNDIKPFECDIFLDLVVTGSINGSIHWLVDTSEKSNPNSQTEAIEGELKVDVKAGAKVSLDFFYLAAVEGEASAKGSTGIKCKIGFNNRIAQGEGLALLVETYFLGLTIEYKVEGKVALYKTFSAGGSLVDDTATILEKTKIEKLSASMVFFEEKENKGSFGKGRSGGGGGGGGW